MLYTGAGMLNLNEISLNRDHCSLGVSQTFRCWILSSKTDKSYQVILYEVLQSNMFVDSKQSNNIPFWIFLTILGVQKKIIIYFHKNICSIILLEFLYLQAVPPHSKICEFVVMCFQI